MLPVENIVYSHIMRSHAVTERGGCDRRVFLSQLISGSAEIGAKTVASESSATAAGILITHSYFEYQCRLV